MINNNVIFKAGHYGIDKLNKFKLLNKLKYLIINIILYLDIVHCCSMRLV